MLQEQIEGSTQRYLKVLETADRIIGHSLPNGCDCQADDREASATNRMEGSFDFE